MKKNTYYTNIEFPIWLEYDFRDSIEALGFEKENIEKYARIWNLAVSKMIEYNAAENDKNIIISSNE
ncbi:MAG: hypothetical protein ACP5N7_03935 [Candidatus Pacearchaeota archaeon]